MSDTVARVRRTSGHRVSVSSPEHIQICLYICLHAGRLPSDALVCLSVCWPSCPSALQSFSPRVSGFSSLEISRARRQPEAICHSGPFCFCAASVRASAAGLSHEAQSNPPLPTQPPSKKTNTYFPRVSTMKHNMCQKMPEQIGSGSCDHRE